MTRNAKRRSRLYFMARQTRCAGPCKRELPFEETTLDHIYPKSLGGSNTFDNFQIMCGTCNSLKGSTVCAA